MITKGNIARFIGLCGVVYILIDPTNTNSVDLILELIKWPDFYAECLLAEKANIQV